MYRGPNAQRIGQQFETIQGWAGEPCVWRQYISATTGTASAYWAGGGETRTYREQTVTGLFAAPQMGEARFRETQYPGGQIIAGDVVVSLSHVLGRQDELQWRGVTYRVEGDSVPVHIGQRVWYRTILRRGDATG